MAIYHLNKASVQRSKGQSAVASAAYISGSKLTSYSIDTETNVIVSRNFDYSNKKGVVFSKILAPDNAPDWVYNREELWGKAEAVEGRINSRPAYKFITALPKELTLEQNIEIAEQFASKYLVSAGMVADINIHYDNENNPHLHIQTTSRELKHLENGEVVFGAKNREWQTIETLRNQRTGWAEVVNQYLELYGCLDRVSHLSYKARGIELTPSIHEGPARHIYGAELQEINRQIIQENAAKIRANPELVFDRLSINKPVFSKEEIAIVLSEALSVDLKLGSASEQLDEKQVAGSNENIRPVGNNVENNNAVVSDIETLNPEYSSEFMLLYHQLLASKKISLINPSDLQGRTLYALSKRVQLEERFIKTVEELQQSKQHNLSIDNKLVDELSLKDRVVSGILEAGRRVQEIVNNKTGLNIDLLEKPQRVLTAEQQKAVMEIVSGNDISVLQGYPGAGKTFVMLEVVRRYKDAGYRVIGAAPSSSAAQVLASATGIESKNIALWRKEWQEAKGEKFELALRCDYYLEQKYQDKLGGNISLTDLSQYCDKAHSVNGELDSKTILIIDEASMIELANMDYLLTEVSRRGAKAIIVGDNNQFAAVGMSGAFKKICAISLVSSLTEVMRHKHLDLDIREQQREATKLMGLYKMDEALKIYQELEGLKVHKNVEEAKEALVKDYINKYLEQASYLKRDDLAAIRSIVIGAYTNVTVNYFNIAIREKLKQSGVLKGLSGNFKSGQEMVELLRGEQIVFTSNTEKYKDFNGVLNGEVATVIDFTHPDVLGHGIIKLLVHKADGSKKIVKVDTADSKSQVRFKHGYAVTGYKLQGETVDYMKVYYEPVIGYEAFNVLMSRHKYEVKLYSAEDILEDIVYKRVAEVAAEGREKFTIEAYRKLNKIKLEVPNWYIGLSLGVSRRVNNNLAIDYRMFDSLSSNEQVIKSYLEFRREVFDLRSKMREWQERQETPVRLARLHGLLKNSGIKIKNKQEITIDPYGLILEFTEHLKEIEGSLGENVQKDEVQAAVKAALVQTLTEVKSRFRSDPPITWTDLSRHEQNKYLYQHLWPHLCQHDIQELEIIHERLQQTKKDLGQYATAICNNYHNVSCDKGEAGTRGKDYLTMGDRIIQLNLNYQTIQRHAGYVNNKYFFKKIKQEATIIGNSHWQEVMKICQGGTKEANKADSLNVLFDNLYSINEFIDVTQLSLIEKASLLNTVKVEQQQLSREIAEITHYQEKLFPAFISRVYKSPALEVLQKWQDLVAENPHYQLSDILARLKQDPSIIDNLKGIGLGSLLGINQGRKDAIINLAVIAKRFKEYQHGIGRMEELQNKLAYGNYDKVVKNLLAEIDLLNKSLPNKYEQGFLTQLNRLYKDGKLNIENFAEIARGEEVQGLIYEYYNYINDQELADAVAGSSTPLPEQEAPSKEHHAIKAPIVKEAPSTGRKFRPRTNKYNSINAVRRNRLDFNEVSSKLSEYNYRSIFEHYAARINSDGKKFKISGNEISFGSLSMNLKKGIWIRYSSWEKGNIFSFVQQALNCSKVEALEQVASIAGISAKIHDYQANNFHNDNYQKQGLELKNIEQINQRSAVADEWHALPYVPEEVVKFNPKVHLAGMLKSNTVDGIYYYRNKQQQLLGLTVRLVSILDGSKQVLPVSYCRNEFLKKEGWRLKGFSDNGYKPIYNLEKIEGDNRQILIVEGEKTCDRAQELLPDYIVLSWLGGSNGSAKVNWQQLQGRETIIWPDHDAAGIKAARIIGQMINEANGHIGRVTIIDPSKLEFNGQMHSNLLPKKWDLADPLPIGLNIENLKEVIKNCQQKNSSLSYTQSLASSLQKVLAPGQELAIGERIFWQARSNSILQAIEQIKQEVATEVSWQEKLTSIEAQYYMKYAESTGKSGSPHEFLRMQDALYRDTIVAIAVNSKIKDLASLELSELIHELQNEYEQKQRALNYTSSNQSFENKDNYHTHITNLAVYGSDRAELYQIMVRDVKLLHQEQFSKKGCTVMPNQQNAIQQEIYRQIAAYQVRQTKGPAGNKLDYNDQVKIASNIYDTLGSHKWWQSLVIQDLTKMHELQQESQEKIKEDCKEHHIPTPINGTITELEKISDQVVDDELKDMASGSRSLEFVQEDHLVKRYLLEHLRLKEAIADHKVSSDLRVHQVLSQNKQDYAAALIAFARDKEGQITGGQIISLDQGIDDKANMLVNKSVFGEINSSFVEVQTKAEGLNSDTTIIAEGIEVALSLQEAGIKGRIVASLELSNIKNYSPLKGEKVLIAADNDGIESSTESVVTKAKAELQSKGAIVAVARPLEKGDFNDVIKQQGKIGIKEVIDPMLVKLQKAHKYSRITQDFTSRGEKDKYLAKVLQGYGKQIIEEAILWGANVSQEQLKQGLSVLGKGQYGQYLMERRNNIINEHLKTQSEKFSKAKLFSNSVPELLMIMEEEQKYLLELDNKLQGKNYDYSFDSFRIINAAKEVGSNPDLVQEVSKMLDVALKQNILRPFEVISLLKSKFNIKDVYQEVDKVLEQYNVRESIKVFIYERQNAKTTEELLQLLKKEQEYLAGLESNLKYPIYDKAIEDSKLVAQEIIKAEVIEKLDKVVNYSITHGVRERADIFKELQQSGDLKASYINLDKECEAHNLNTKLNDFSINKEKETNIAKVFKVLEQEQEFLVESYDRVKYLEQYPQELRDRVIGAYQVKQNNIINELHNLSRHIEKYQIIKEDKLVEHLKNNHNPLAIAESLTKICQGHYNSYVDHNINKLMQDDKELEIRGHKFDCPIKYLKHEISNPAHEYADIARFKKLVPQVQDLITEKKLELEMHKSL